MGPPLVKSGDPRHLRLLNHRRNRLPFWPRALVTVDCPQVPDSARNFLRGRCFIAAVASQASHLPHWQGGAIIVSQQTVQSFIQALDQAERSRDVEPLVQLFAPDAELVNPNRSTSRAGPSGTRQFWQEYLSAFQDIHSEFTRVLESDNFATLEWRSQGTLPNGHAINYRGVSLLEFGEDQVKRFVTYYNSAAFLPEGAK